MSWLLSKEEGLGGLLVHSDLTPKLEGGAEIQREPLAWLQNRSFANISSFKSGGIPIHWEPLGIGASGVRAFPDLGFVLSLFGACGSGLLLPQGCPGELFP